MKQLTLLDYSHTPVRAKKVSTGTMILKHPEVPEDRSGLIEKPSRDVFSPLNTKILQDRSGVSSFLDLKEKNVVSSIVETVGHSLQPSDPVENELMVDEIKVGSSSLRIPSHHKEMVIRRKRRHMIIPKSPSDQSLVKKRKSEVASVRVPKFDNKKHLELSVEQDYQNDSKPEDYSLNLTISTRETGRSVSCKEVRPSEVCEDTTNIKMQSSPSRRNPLHHKHIEGGHLISEGTIQTIDGCTLQEVTATQDVMLLSTTNPKSCNESLQTATPTGNKVDKKARNRKTKKSICHEDMCCISNKSTGSDGQLEASAGTSEDRLREAGGGEEESENDQIVMVVSTPQEKEARRLARQRQLKNMRAWEEAESRRERALRRRNRIGCTEEKSGHNERECKIKWKEDETLVSVFEYSPKDELDEGIHCPHISFHFS